MLQLNVDVNFTFTMFIVHPIRLNVVKTNIHVELEHVAQLDEPGRWENKCKTKWLISQHSMMNFYVGYPNLTS